MDNRKRAVWGTRLGFYFAAIGSAFGLGNVWRFPYVVTENGGGAFVLLYLFFLFLIGMPLLMAELLLGKTTRRSVVAALDRVRRPMGGKHPPLAGKAPSIIVGKEPWLVRYLPVVGKVSVLVGLIVLAYFGVISGWVLYFLGHTLGALVLGQSFSPDLALSTLLENGWLQVVLTSVHLLLVIVVVAKDVEDGLERWVGFMMPVFGVLMVALASQTLSLPTSGDALRFLFYPDFSQLTYSSMSQALGHVFFTLSIGFGSMVTFGSYLQQKAFIPIAGFRVATIDSIISLGAGLLIFPLLLSTVSGSAGPELLFRTVPVLFREISGGLWFGAGFFLCLYLAALGASIGLLETVVSNLKDSQKVKREKGAWWAGFICLSLAVVPALSTSVLSNVKVRGLGLLEICDALLINWILPVVALLVCQGVLYGLSDQVKRGEFIEDTEGLPNPEQDRLYGHWVFILRWVVPTVILSALALQLIGLIRNL
ncbi:MAG: sodium-dependent transporter [Bdellovibrionaceae bacterium]|nr:sodium-dependent transporter [Bdellovibrionales bacterium]MCB9083909.1 sodium-dependent transporter [Pseudobdellovibrionaceae bacterium]